MAWEKQCKNNNGNWNIFVHKKNKNVCGKKLMTGLNKKIKIRI